jgi:energy-coupling factor transporter ATP-binding protein EcfA2
MMLISLATQLHWLLLHSMDDDADGSAIEEMSAPGLRWTKDKDWGKPFVAYKGAERFKAVDELYMKGLFALVNGERYMFVDTLNYWCNLAAKIAMLRLCGLMDIKNATVNYPDATVGYNEYIIKRCDANEATALPVSICVGTMRLEVTMIPEKKMLVFSESRTVIDRTGKIGSVPDIVYQACVMPIRSTIRPTDYIFPGKCMLLGHMAQLYPDPRDMVTVLWHIGNCILDPVSNPKSIMFYGPGGSGKSTILRIIANILGSCCGLLPDGCLTSKNEGMPVSVSSVIASNRMAVCYDVALDKFPLNMSVFKNISGSDYVRVGELYVKTNCSLTIGTNGYPDIDKQPEYNDDAIMRRIVGIVMDVSALDIPNVTEPSGADDRLDVACGATYMRMLYEYIPVSPVRILSTLTSSYYAHALQLIEETSDVISKEEAHEVLCIIGVIIKSSPESVAYKARLVSRTAVFELDGKMFIKGLRPVGS